VRELLSAAELGGETLGHFLSPLLFFLLSFPYLLTPFTPLSLSFILSPSIPSILLCLRKESIKEGRA
jgi:hypothetical protein